MEYGYWKRTYKINRLFIGECDDSWSVFATPFWEGDALIPITLQGGPHDYDEHIMELPFKPTLDLKKDFLTYTKKMKSQLNKISKSLALKW